MVLQWASGVSLSEMHQANPMNTENTLTLLRNALARRKARKALLARLARNKAEAMEAVYGYKASLALRLLATEAETALALNKA
jgi:hypothetical protein